MFWFVFRYKRRLLDPLLYNTTREGGEQLLDQLLYQADAEEASYHHLIKRLFGPF